MVTRELRRCDSPIPFEIEQYWLKAEHDGQSFGEMTTEYVQWQLVLHYPDSFKIAYINEQFNKDLTTRQSDQQNSSDEKADVEINRIIDIKNNLNLTKYKNIKMKRY